MKSRRREIFSTLGETVPGSLRTLASTLISTARKGDEMLPFWPRDVYLDHNATTPVHPDVAQAMARCLSKDFGNPSSLHITGRRARGLIDQARSRVAALLGCAPECLLFTSGGTEANNTVIKGVWGAAGAGHVVSSMIEHDSVIGACCQVREAGGGVTRVPASRDGRVDPAQIEEAVRDDTILISIMHANNETGAIQPIEQIARIARRRGVPLHVDAVQTYGKIPTLVDELGCEFLSLSAHKLGGPKGVGAIFWRGNTTFSPQNFGGLQEQSLRAGTEGVHQIVGLGVAADLARRRMTAERPRQRGLRKKAVEGIRGLVPGARINEADPDHQLPGTISVTLPEHSGLSLLAGLDCLQVCVSIGSACTADSFEPSHVLSGRGLSDELALSTIRVSTGTTTTRRDIDYFIWALETALRGEPDGLSFMPPEHLTRDRILSEDTYLVDLRLGYERMLSPSIPGARQWSSIGRKKSMKKVPREREAILMCTTGILSYKAGYDLARAGHTRVRVVHGGYAAWRALFPDLCEQLARR